METGGRAGRESLRGQVSFNVVETPGGPRPTRGPVVDRPARQPFWDRWAPARPGHVFGTYWKFAWERQSTYFRRLKGSPPPWTGDPIIGAFRFTNAYRVSDRVSQYLIQRVIYSAEWSPEDLFFRVLLFKVFNKIETWELLEREVGPLAYGPYRFDAYDEALTRAMDRGEKVYSAAYIMPSAGSFGHQRKHRNHLRLLEAMMADGVPAQVGRCSSLREVFELLKSYSGVGDFLAYQWSIDLNYSELIDFSEMEFVVAGPGAKDGIGKCFSSTGGLSEPELIRQVCDRQEEEFARAGVEFDTLWGRRLQLIDCQSLFCEVDKYARMAHPEVRAANGRSRIKQKYRSGGKLARPWFPPKWGINEQVKEWWERHHADDRG